MRDGAPEMRERGGKKSPEGVSERGEGEKMPLSATKSAWCTSGNENSHHRGLCDGCLKRPEWNDDSLSNFESLIPHDIYDGSIILPARKLKWRRRERETRTFRDGSNRPTSSPLVSSFTSSIRVFTFITECQSGEYREIIASVVKTRSLRSH